MEEVVLCQDSSTILSEVLSACSELIILTYRCCPPPWCRYCEEIPAEDNEVNDNSSKSSIEAKPDASPQLHKKSVTNSTLTSTGSSEALASVSTGAEKVWPSYPKVFKCYCLVFINFTSFPDRALISPSPFPV